MAGECAKEEGHDSGDVVIMFIWRAIAPAFFRGEILQRETPMLVRDEQLRTDLSVADRRAVPPDN